ncbi:MAG: Mce protein [Mycobacterium sp.]
MADDAATPTGEVSESASEPVEAAAVEPAADVEDFDAVADDEAAVAKPGMSHIRLATIVGLVVVVALAGLVGWLGVRAYESQGVEAQRQLFLQVGRQGAINLTSINFEQAESDVQRILDSATGTFYDDFQQRAGPFIEVVKQAQSKSVGTVTEAGLESESDNEARVLVAVTVQTSNAGAAEQQPRLWRMRVTVQDVGDEQVKVSNVEFVP